MERLTSHGIIGTDVDLAHDEKDSSVNSIGFNDLSNNVKCSSVS